MIRKFQSDPRGLLKSSSLKGPQAVSRHLVVARHNFTLTCIPLSQILYKCFFIDIGSGHLYVGLAPTKLKAISLENSTAINSCFKRIFVKHNTCVCLLKPGFLVCHFP